jgi:ABC-type transporter MlaC component
MEQYGLPFEVNHSVMAKGGEVTNYKTSVVYYPNQEVIAFVDFSGKHKSVMSRPYSQANKEEVIEFAKKIAERNNGTYEGYYDFSNALKMAQGGEVFYTEKHKND